MHGIVCLLGDVKHHLEPVHDLTLGFIATRVQILEEQLVLGDALYRLDEVRGDGATKIVLMLQVLELRKYVIGKLVYRAGSRRERII